MVSLKEVGIAVAAFLVKYVVVFVVSKNLVEVEVVSDTDDLSAGATAGVVVAVAFAGVAFNNDYIVFVVDDVVLAGSFGLFIVIAVDDAGVLAAAHVDALCLCNDFLIDDLAGFCLYSVQSLCLVFTSSKTNCLDLNATLLSLTISE